MLAKQFPVRALPLLVASLFSGYAGAAGFQLLEQNASGLGNAYAGSAAVAEDASTIFFNPAGMSYLPAGKKHLAASVELVKPTTKFSNNGSIPPARITRVGGNGGDAGDWAAIPNGYFAMPLTDQISAGIGFGAPFGLKTEYDSDWVGRFRAIKSDVKTININPSVSFKVNDKVSLGLGVSYQQLDAELTNAVNFSGALCLVPASAQLAALCGAGLLNNLEGVASVSGDEWEWGYNLGVMFQPSPTTRVGLSYRSAIKYTVNGSVTFSRPTVAVAGPITAPVAGALNTAIAGATPDGPVKLDIKLPDVAIVSAYQKLSDQWELLGDVSWTGWAKIPKLEIFRSNGTLLSSTTENWRNTWRVALGANYKYSDQIKLRMGLAYDQTPVKDEFRTPRLPDTDRYWLALGGQYKLTKDSALDVGYVHIFMRDGSINDNGGSAASQALSGLLKGNYENSVDIVGAQYSMSF